MNSRRGPHNSGHFTFDANVTSQIEQRRRAVCGLPLGSTELMTPADPSVKLHLYGKLEPGKAAKSGISRPWE